MGMIILFFLMIINLIVAYFNKDTRGLNLFAAGVILGLLFASIVNIIIK